MNATSTGTSPVSDAGTLICAVHTSGKSSSICAILITATDVSRKRQDCVFPRCELSPGASAIVLLRKLFARVSKRKDVIVQAGRLNETDRTASHMISNGDRLQHATQNAVPLNTSGEFETNLTATTESTPLRCSNSPKHGRTSGLQPA